MAGGGDWADLDEEWEDLDELIPVETQNLQKPRVFSRNAPVVCCPLCENVGKIRLLKRRNDRHMTEWECLECGNRWSLGGDAGRNRAYLT